MHALLGELVKTPHLRGVSSMKHLLEQAPSLRVKAPPPGGILLNKMPPYEGVLSAGNRKKVKQVQRKPERPANAAGSAVKSR